MGTVDESDWMNGGRSMGARNTRTNVPIEVGKVPRNIKCGEVHVIQLHPHPWKKGILHTE